MSLRNVALSVVASTLLPAAMLCSPVNANTITNTTSNTLLFYDNGFENVPIPPLSNTPESHDADNPVASVGSWSVEPGENNLVYYAGVRDSATSTHHIPAFTGTQYLEQARFIAGKVLVRYVDEPQSNVGDVIHFETMVYLPSASDVPLAFSFAILNSDRTALTDIATSGTGTVLKLEGASWAPTSLQYIPDQWQKWEVDFVVGDTTEGSASYTVTIDDVVSETITLREFFFPPSAPRNFFGLMTRGGDNGNVVFYLDSVDEPDVTIMADLNMDGFVDIFDVNIVSDNWGGSGPAGDANTDGVVDIFDVNVISDNWGPVAATVVPEPPGAVLAAFGAIACTAVLTLSRKRPALA